MDNGIARVDIDWVMDESETKGSEMEKVEPIIQDSEDFTLGLKYSGGDFREKRRENRRK